jgi:hypothetical protein
MGVDGTFHVSTYCITRSSSDAVLVAATTQEALYCSAQPVYNEQYWCRMSATSRASRPCKRHAVQAISQKDLCQQRSQRFFVRKIIFLSYVLVKIVSAVFLVAEIFVIFVYL